MRNLQTPTGTTLFKTLTDSVLRRGQKSASKQLISPVKLAFSATHNLAIDADRSTSSSPPVQNTAQPLTAHSRRSS